MYFIVNFIDSLCMVYTSVRKNLCAASPRQECKETPKKTGLFVGKLELPGIPLRWTIWVWIRLLLTPIKVDRTKHTMNVFVCCFHILSHSPKQFFLPVWVNMSFPSSHSIPTLPTPSPPLWVLHCSKKRTSKSFHFGWSPTSMGFAYIVSSLKLNYSLYLRVTFHIIDHMSISIMYLDFGRKRRLEPKN